jgi:hypothetical protein
MRLLRQQLAVICHGYGSTVRCASLQAIKRIGERAKLPD